MHNLKIALLFFVSLLAGLVTMAADSRAVGISEIRFGKQGANTRTVLELDAEVDFRAMVQDNPARIVIDIPAVGAAPAIRRSEMPKLIKDIRLEPLQGGYSRITLMLGQTATIRTAFLIPATDKMPVRLVVDAGPATQPAFTSAVNRPYGTLRLNDSATPPAEKTGGGQAKLPMAPPSAGIPAVTADKAPAKPATPGILPFAGAGGAKLDTITKPDAPQVAPVATPALPAAVKAPDQKPLIMIDAGHGGVDPGASGSGVTEKNVTLAVAKALRDRIQAGGRYRAALTRDDDSFIPLGKRVRIARDAGAALFISIHADSVTQGGAGVSGASFYTLSDKASDAQSAQLAARENDADLLAGVDVPADDREVAGILIDLTLRETTRDSEKFSARLVNTFGDEKLPLLFSPRRHAGFMVLKAPDVPSVLIELGFLSNPEEVKKLDDPAYRDSLAGAIAKGVDLWFAERRKR